MAGEASMYYTLCLGVVAVAAVGVFGNSDVGRLSFVLGACALIVAGVYVVEAVVSGESLMDGSPKATIPGAGSGNDSALKPTPTVDNVGSVIGGEPANLAAEDRELELATVEDGDLATAPANFTEAAPYDTLPPKLKRQGELLGCFACFTAPLQNRRRGAKAATEPAKRRPPASQLALGSGRSEHSSEEVQRLCDLGRVLEAERLLGVPAKGSLPEESDAVGDLEQTDAHTAALRRVVAATRQFIEEVGTGENWKRKELPGGHLLYSYDQATGVGEFIATLALDVQPLRLWSFFREFDLSPTWIRNNELSYPICNYTGARELYHFRAKPLIRYLTSGTEAFQERTYVDGLDGPTGFLLCVGFATPVDASDYDGVELSEPAPGYKRIATEGRDMVRPEYREGELRSLLTLHRKLKTPFSVPEWAVSKMVGSVVQMQMSSLQRALGAWVGSEHEQRVLHGPRAEYYANLSARLESVAKASAGQ